ncbi:MAG: FMN-binding negative transcriptional regulator [Cytophagales bacterium]
MYVTKTNRNENTEELLEFIRQNGFGILVSQVEGKPWATHIPMHLSPDGKKLTSHIARGNPQWRSWNNTTEVLAIFQGPHAYVSSSWYDHENVPTWNYIAVHVYGTIRLIEGDELVQSLKHLVDKYEKASSHPVTVEGMSAKFLQNEIRAIVAFEITINRLEAAYKLSQNRDDKNYKEIVHQLEERGDADSVKVAEQMKRRRSI